MKRGCRLAGPSSDREVETQNGVRLDGCTSWLAWLHLPPPMVPVLEWPINGTRRCNVSAWISSKLISIFLSHMSQTPLTSTSTAL